MQPQNKKRTWKDYLSITPFIFLFPLVFLICIVVGWHFSIENVYLGAAIFLLYMGFLGIWLGILAQRQSYKAGADKVSWHRQPAILQGIVPLCISGTSFIIFYYRTHPNDRNLALIFVLFLLVICMAVAVVRGLYYAHQNLKIQRRKLAEALERRAERTRIGE